MKALIQRVSRASVSVGEEVVGEIGPGLVILLGVARNDSEQDAQVLADKIINLRIFADDKGKFNLSALDSQAELLVVSQFTLLADTQKGRRPSFIDAAPPEIAEPLCQRFIDILRASKLKVETGRFREHMLVEIHNDGPVTLWLDSRKQAISP